MPYLWSSSKLESSAIMRKGDGLSNSLEGTVTLKTMGMKWFSKPTEEKFSGDL